MGLLDKDVYFLLLGTTAVSIFMTPFLFTAVHYVILLCGWTDNSLPPIELSPILDSSSVHAHAHLSDADTSPCPSPPSERLQITNLSRATSD